MGTIDHLPAEQFAALRLIVSGRTYREVADSLAISPESVRTNAQLAVSTLAAEEGRSLTQSERGRVADWLLGETGEEPLVAGSPAARAFAAKAASQLEAIEGARLPDLPPLPDAAIGAGSTKARKAFATTRPSKAASAADSKRSEPRPDDKDPVSAGRESNNEPRTPEISRRGGLILLVASAIAIALAVFALSGGFSDESAPKPGARGNTTTPAGPGGTTTTGNGSSPTAGWTLRRRYALKSVTGSKAVGIGGLESKGSQNAILIAGSGLAPSTTVGIWLVGGPQPGLVGFQKVNSKGEFTAIGPVPRVAPESNRIIVTSESVTPGGATPTTPGSELLSGQFSF